MAPPAPATTATTASALHVLDRRDVQRICSGQSVVDLATAVKELVENALDAGASQIEVKLKEFGRDSFEVSDNGAGVALESYATLARKHYTSKISSFEDIARVESFGFRCVLLRVLRAKVTCAECRCRSILCAIPYKNRGEALSSHYAKLLKVLQAYAVSCANVKICVFNVTGKNGSRHVVLATQAHQSMGENIANVFGTKFFRTMLRVEFELCDSPKEEEAATKATEADGTKDDVEEQTSTSATDDGGSLSAQERKVVGYVSKVGAGMAKALNEVWRQYEMKQKPACVLNFQLPLGDYDVNVTPDKRETFIKRVRAHPDAYFVFTRVGCLVLSCLRRTTMFQEAQIVDAFKTSLNKVYEPSRGTFTVQPLMSVFARSAKVEELTESPLISPPSHEDDTVQLATGAVGAGASKEDSDSARVTPQPDEVRMHEEETAPQEPKHVIVEILMPRSQQIVAPNRVEKASNEPEGVTDASQSPRAYSPPLPRVVVDRTPAKRQKLHTALATETTPPTPEEHVWSFGEMLKQRQQYFAEEVEHQRKRKTRLKVPKVCSTSTNDDEMETDNEVAAAALQRVLKKEDFKRMEVLGQFNLGFIIGKLDNDLFIIDQHASDEKFNYETLQQTTIMHQQPLVRPLMLEVTAGEEMVILDHLDVFAKNGFAFLVDKEAAATKKLKLLSLPFTKHTQFGTEGKYMLGAVWLIFLAGFS
ncbi:hypothetical protein BBJ28_00014544 [Nothophytophthora sp. Chile5]|nr:hypothetical protein BBJ28_00014544 [Nothophytophthora sp. Chile5]